MGRRLFNPDGMLWRPLGYLGELVMMSLLWAVCCIPLVTIGSSTAALYDAAVHVVVRKDDTLFRRFFGTFRRELGSGIRSTLVWATAAVAVWGLYRGLAAFLPEGGARGVVLIFYLVLVPFFLLCVFCWVFPILSRFTMGTAALNVTAVRLAFGHILRSAAMALVTAVGAAACWFFVVPMMVVPALVALFGTLLMEPVFLKYEAPKAEE